MKKSTVTLDFRNYESTVVIKLVFFCLSICFNTHGMDKTQFDQLYKEYLAIKQSIPEADQEKVFKFEDSDSNQNRDDSKYRSCFIEKNITKDTVLKAVASGILCTKIVFEKSTPNPTWDYNYDHELKLWEECILQVLFFKGSQTFNACDNDANVDDFAKKTYLNKVLGLFHHVSSIEPIRNNFLINDKRFLTPIQCTLNLLYDKKYPKLRKYIPYVVLVGGASSLWYKAGIDAPIGIHIFSLLISASISFGLSSASSKSLRYVWLPWCYKNRLYPDDEYIKKVVSGPKKHIRCNPQYCSYFKQTEKDIPRSEMKAYSYAELKQSIKQRVGFINLCTPNFRNFSKLNYYCKCLQDYDQELCGYRVRSLEEFQNWITSKNKIMLCNDNTHFGFLIKCLVMQKNCLATGDQEGAEYYDQVGVFIEKLGNYQKTRFHQQVKELKEPIWFCFKTSNVVHEHGQTLQKFKGLMRDIIKEPYTFARYSEDIRFICGSFILILFQLSILAECIDRNIVFHLKAAGLLWSIAGASLWLYDTFAFTLSPYPPDSFYDE